MTSDGASVGAFQEALAELDRERQSGELGAGDTVVLWLETHLLSFKGDDQLAMADSAGQLPFAPAMPVEPLLDILGQLTDYGCRVLVLLDTVHHQPGGPPGWKSQQASLARDLYRRNVTVFLASVQGPGLRLSTEGHGVFAQAILLPPRRPSPDKIGHGFRWRGILVAGHLSRYRRTISRPL